MSGGSRPSKSQRTRATLQEIALRLFDEQGYEATSVAQIAQEAGVSHMTFFRHFPSKEEVVLEDEYNPLLEELIRGQPATVSGVERVHAAVLTGLERLGESDRYALLRRVGLLLSIPALRSRIDENLASARTAFERGLAADGEDGTPSLAVRAVAAACSAVLSAAVVDWAQGEGEQDLAGLVDEAFRALRGAV
ncbi:TetR/AcrR family transcriptional regulator [Nocardiopsis kunsanensis]|uniref:TetR family transcriptional regulator n=1 Tax=Nocardiopsis kunsanensis TaxID=141693 RepID=A0A918XI03_9ACTN|nr:TetR/AcrR family transcriptional regulator [Nocardiopsis kunsanensis]GHD31591.1 TetR family transcriptional regulator [Nocardiopsis kunsanensis]